MADRPKRNEPCHCGSGKKYKNCCQKNDEAGRSSKIAMIGVAAVVFIVLILVAMSLFGGGSPVDCPPGTVWSDAHQHCH
ncbi:hypothetical protein DYD21_04450 [Rhodohalobacter sp. SW132]|uniref:SEC-C metal-binding domain-containing protein n=1 Tax=Rhodohalobacter sp. SW132 TaxID=2293433 RepID=UPI000E241538|nr:SEC-C metal-binding domain-containing protein [Rhodohalobacter sp. SW132]REL39210.1 hypothetical protein DYD21_04450 [Rhodohalobacter sp. SW132]